MILAPFSRARWAGRPMRVLRQLYASPARTFDLYWEVVRRYCFTLGLLALLVAKLLHLYAHLHSLPTAKFLLWGPTFLFQDVVAILLLRLATQRLRRRPLAVSCAVVVIPFSLAMSIMASTNLSFYVVTGAEIHWRQAKTFHRDAAAVRTLLTGLTGFMIVEAILLAVTLCIARPVHRAVGGVIAVLTWPWRGLWSWLRPRRDRGALLPDPDRYAQVAEAAYDDDKSDSEDSLAPFESMRRADLRPMSTGRRLAILIPILALLVIRALRPIDPSYIFLSGALPLTPFTGTQQRASPVDAAGMPGNYRVLEGQTALNVPPAVSWLPHTALPGFEDWSPLHPSRKHYDPSKDPLHISNLDKPVLESIRQVLDNGTVRIKHVILLKLESTRADLFPLRKDSFMWKRIIDSYGADGAPEDVKERVANLTRTAQYLTGVNGGFTHDDHLFGGKKAYGGISASNAFTTGTYTLKSLVGTLCGVTPLVTDFNREYQQHIYQPCMPHILNAINHQPDITNASADFTRWPWHSAWMQSVTSTYDNQDKLTPVLGFRDIQTRETLRGPSAKHYPPKSKEINYYGYPDTELREYVRDAIDDAERNHTRLFLTHLTGTTHHDWGLPEDHPFKQIMAPSWTGSENELNRYLNTIHFVDSWLAEILGILEEKGVAEETLIVMAGDHGISLPNDGGRTPYDNPHIGSFHIPIVLAHPRLPPLEISTPVMSDQILPTILDLLVESRSLSPNATEVATDVRALYEGQSMIRPLKPTEGSTQDWQFTVMNTGGSWLAVRSAARPEYRLVVPLIDDLEWRFTHLYRDPQELNPSKEFNLVDLAKVLDREYGEDVVNWLRDAAHISEWWVMENWRRYRYTPDARNSTQAE